VIEQANNRVRSAENAALPIDELHGVTTRLPGNVREHRAKFLKGNESHLVLRAAQPPSDPSAAKTAIAVEDHGGSRIIHEISD
jgi:hypothetical protein